VLTRFRTRKTAEMLAYLAYHRTRSHPREILIDLLWPECEPDVARHNLSVALSWRRHQIEPPGTPPGTLLLADRFSLRLNPEAVTTDVAELEAALSAAAALSEPPERAAHLTHAVELYRGELLPGFYSDWIFPEQQRLEELFQHALRHLIRDFEAAG